MLIIMAFYIALDGFQVQLSGILRGTGRQAYAAPVIGLPHELWSLPTDAMPTDVHTDCLQS